MAVTHVETIQPKRPKLHAGPLFMLALAAALLVWGMSSGADAVDPQPLWRAHQAGSTLTVDHSAWNALLKKYVVVREPADGPNLVDYAALQASAADRAKLDGYLERLADVEVGRLDRDEQFAYWANLYNALTVDLVAENYPVRSIRNINISPGLFSTGPWGAELIEVEGRAVSLDDIEHRILRPGWRDPRVHYALNCASIGCPDLAPKAYTGKTLDAALEQAARAYINSPRGVRVENGRVTASKIYDWYGEDFGKSAQNLLAHFALYADDDLAAELSGVNRISRYDYDWALNGAPNRL